MTSTWLPDRGVLNSSRGSSCHTRPSLVSAHDKCCRVYHWPRLASPSLKHKTASLIRKNFPSHAHFMTPRGTQRSPRPVSWLNFWFPGSRVSLCSFLLWLWLVLGRKVLLDGMWFPVLLCEDKLPYTDIPPVPNNCSSPDPCDDHPTPSSPIPDTVAVGL